MIRMVQGDNSKEGDRHKSAMVERARRPFHYEFTTIRFLPFKESGSWKGDANFLGPH